MNNRKRTRLRFSLKTLFALVTIAAVCFGGWIEYSRYKIRKLVALRQQGVIVIVRDRTPKLLRSVGITNLSPFFDVPTVELYVTPKGADALVGNSETLLSDASARQRLLEQAAIARSYGAADIQLIQVDGSSPEWSAFADENSLLRIGESNERYKKRLKANQETGANINP
jgi:hypothetical protein